MPYYHYTIRNNRVAVFNGEISALPPGFIPYEGSFEIGKIYYKMGNSHIAEVICDVLVGEEQCHAEIKAFMDKLSFD